MDKRWIFADRQPAIAARLARDLRVSPITAHLLVARGVSDVDSARSFLRPALDHLRDPMTLPGMSAAAARVERALRQDEKIGVFGDYDVDGATGAAILQKFFALLGRSVSIRIPHRVADGYGLNAGAVDQFASEGVRLLITVDCGTNDAAEIETAVARGMEVVVLDHHEPPAKLPPACAIVNPKVAGSSGASRGLCSAALAFKLCWALSNGMAGSVKMRSDFQTFLIDAMGLVALGTVADVAPLVDENRILVRYGLDALRACRSPGLRALIQRSRLEAEAIDAEAISFRLAPRLNALGRVGNAQDAFDLLTSDDPARLERILDVLESSNRARKDIEDAILEQARARLNDDPVIVVADAGWHVGVVGIVAARLVDEFARPAFVLAIEGEIARGSGRSIDGFPLHEALQACRETLISGGGHARAAGVSLRASEIERFRAGINEYAAAHLRPEAPALRIDDEVPLAQVTQAVVREIGMLAPHGEGNPVPTFVASHLRTAGQPRLMGKRNAHMSFFVSQGGGPAVRAVAFGGGALYDAVVGARTLSLAFTPQINAWGGREEVELIVKDVKLV